METTNYLPLTHLIRSALTNVDVDLRATLLTNVVVTGGTSLMAGFVDRLNSDLLAAAPGVRVLSLF
jgi:actin-related protein 4